MNLSVVAFVWLVTDAVAFSRSGVPACHLSLQGSSSMQASSTILLHPLPRVTSLAIQMTTSSSVSDEEAHLDENSSSSEESGSKLGEIDENVDPRYYEGTTREDRIKVESYYADKAFSEMDLSTSWITAKRNKPPQEELVMYESEEWRRWRMIRYYEMFTLISSIFAILNPMLFINGHDKYYSVIHKPVERVIVFFGELCAVLTGKVLRDAVEHDRLGSETYKRMNLSIVLFSIIQIYLLRTDPYHSLYKHSFDIGSSPCRGLGIFWLLSYVSFIYTGLKGFAKGVRGFGLIDLEVSIGPVDDLFKDLAKGTVTTLKSLIKFPNISSVGYFIGMLGVIKSIKSFGMYSPPYLLLASFSIFALKDASDRGRLDGGTFMSFNVLLFVSSLAGK